MNVVYHMGYFSKMKLLIPLILLEYLTFTLLNAIIDATFVKNAFPFYYAVHLLASMINYSAYPPY